MFCHLCLRIAPSDDVTTANTKHTFADSPAFGLDGGHFGSLLSAPLCFVLLHARRTSPVRDVPQRGDRALREMDVPAGTARVAELGELGVRGVGEADSCPPGCRDLTRRASSPTEESRGRARDLLAGVRLSLS